MTLADVISGPLATTTIQGCIYCNNMNKWNSWKDGQLNPFHVKHINGSFTATQLPFLTHLQSYLPCSLDVYASSPSLSMCSTPYIGQAYLQLHTHSLCVSVSYIILGGENSWVAGVSLQRRWEVLYLASTAEWLVYFPREKQTQPHVSLIQMGFEPVCSISICPIS